MQAFACLEGPTSECYEDEIITFGNPTYPTRESLQHLVDDFYSVLIFAANRGKQRLCACSDFLLIPTPAQLTAREFEVAFQPLAMDEIQIQFDDVRNDMDDDENVSLRRGLPPKIAIPLNNNNIVV